MLDIVLKKESTLEASHTHLDMDMDMQEDFEQYAEKAKTLPPTQSNEDLLILYGLYKQATVGPVNTSECSCLTNNNKSMSSTFEFSLSLGGGGFVIPPLFSIFIRTISLFMNFLYDLQAVRECST